MLRSFIAIAICLLLNANAIDEVARASFYKGVGGKVVKQTKDFEKVRMPNGTVIIRPKNYVN